MRRAAILKYVSKYLKEANKVTDILEVFFDASDSASKSRSIFIVDCEDGQKESLLQRINHYYAHHFSIRSCWYPSIRDLELSTFLPQDESNLIYNWRGRIISKGEIDGVVESDVDLLSEKLLHSVWRIIVQKSTTDFFVRHDIFPRLYYPGHSTAGKPDFVESVRHSVETITRNGGFLMDRNFDSIKCFLVSNNRNSIQCGARHKAPEAISEGKIVADDFIRGLEGAIRS